MLSLVEGSYGTLYRHRAMAIPWVILTASPTLVELAIPSLKVRVPLRASARRPDAVT